MTLLSRQCRKHRRISFKAISSWLRQKSLLLSTVPEEFQEDHPTRHIKGIQHRFTNLAKSEKTLLYRLHRLVRNKRNSIDWDKRKQNKQLGKNLQTTAVKHLSTKDVHFTSALQGNDFSISSCLFSCKVITKALCLSVSWSQYTGIHAFYNSHWWFFMQDTN